MIPPVRKPYVAGSFYPAHPQSLRDFLSASLKPFHPLREAKAVILPHAGYVYSGKTAGEVLRRVRVPNSCFLIGPNHEGGGEPFALYPAGAWETPLGVVPIQQEFAAGLLESSHDLRTDFETHEKEHSLEVEVPFLQTRNPQVEIVPLLVGTRDLDSARRLSAGLAEFLKGRSGFLIAASSDMSHYESDPVTRKKDRYALEAIEALDEEALVEAVEVHDVTMCGYVPVYLTLLLAKELGARRAELIDYRTSAEASGDYDRVVGYAGFVIE